MFTLYFKETPTVSMPPKYFKLVAYQIDIKRDAHWLGENYSLAQILKLVYRGYRVVMIPCYPQSLGDMRPMQYAKGYRAPDPIGGHVPMKYTFNYPLLNRLLENPAVQEELKKQGLKVNPDYCAELLQMIPAEKDILSKAI